MQKLLTAVPGACCGLDIAPLEKVIQYAPERLFGDCQQFQQFADRHARLARDKIKCSMVRTAKYLLRQRLVDGPRHVAVAEVKQLDSAPDFVFAQKERRCGGCLDRHLEHTASQAYGMASLMRGFVLQRIIERVE